MNAALDWILSTEATMTGAAVIVVWAIIGGPMRSMKPRYKAFMFFVAFSMAGATIDKVNFLAGGDAETVIVAKTIIAAARLGMVLCGMYILLRWRSQCARILAMLERRQPHYRRRLPQPLPKR